MGSTCQAAAAAFGCENSITLGGVDFNIQDICCESCDRKIFFFFF